MKPIKLDLPPDPAPVVSVIQPVRRVVPVDCRTCLTFHACLACKDVRCAGGDAHHASSPVHLWEPRT